MGCHSNASEARNAIINVSEIMEDYRLMLLLIRILSGCYNRYFSFVFHDLFCYKIVYCVEVK